MTFKWRQYRSNLTVVVPPLLLLFMDDVGSNDGASCGRDQKERVCGT